MYITIAHITDDDSAITLNGESIVPWLNVLASHLPRESSIYSLKLSLSRAYSIGIIAKP